MSGTPVSTIRNLGPAFQAECTRAGIPDAETLRSLGAHEAYRRLLAAGTRPHFIGYFVLHMALQGRPWNDCRGAEKTALRAQFDALRAEARPAPEDAFLARLDEIGVIAPRRPETDG
ncbi:TfoX/Sxy family protein [Pseudoponticoccus marisrubri]|uniref:Competence protein TfoX n=1 Tax=Pseudoponticoccus marisrubri TaxID=1685382 RepID=A0A0W7WMZ1_9RHOB|nr:TfoX/Sxy family protein [Pseudoponticoccus marisrubri]KUF11947.1 competence protein TfoX [Pseudoponticoccus marisrubri]